MVSRLAQPLQSSRQKGPKSAKSVNRASAPTQSLKIGEAARLLGVETYVLRFWETQFPELHPYHTATRHRLYSAQDIETLNLIKHLLYEEGFTIEGARKRIKELAQTPALAKASSPAATRSAGKQAPLGKAASIPTPGAERQMLSDIRRDLESLYQLLKD